MMQISKLELDKYDDDGSLERERCVSVNGSPAPLEFDSYSALKVYIYNQLCTLSSEYF